MLICLVVLVVNISIELHYSLQGLESCPESLQLEQHRGCNRRDNLGGKKHNEIVHATIHNSYRTVLTIC